MLAPNQTKFESCYRHRHHAIFHLAYLRRAKVCLIEELIAQSRLPLENARILDFGFGAGTFFRRCPVSAALYGVELDEESLHEVAAGLRRRGHRHVDLRRSATSDDLARFWPDTFFDLIVCSHVLEHVSEPEQLLRDLAARLSASGRLVCLVPINERGDDPKHVNHFDRASLEQCCQQAGLSFDVYLERDEWMYWIQPLFLREGRTFRLAMQAISLTLGLLFCAPGWTVWRTSGRIWARLSGAKPSQAGVVLSR